ncbi:hypothetical protein QBC32DRAFT_177303, partial [Pseudoneurospora amorphoporcata]
TEKVLREETARLGFKAVIVRAGVQCETNHYAADGTVLTYYDPGTGRKRNMHGGRGWTIPISRYI